MLIHRRTLSLQTILLLKGLITMLPHRSRSPPSSTQLQPIPSNRLLWTRLSLLNLPLPYLDPNNPTLPKPRPETLLLASSTPQTQQAGQLPLPIMLLQVPSLCSPTPSPPPEPSLQPEPKRKPSPPSNLPCDLLLNSLSDPKLPL
jgi:hypothetical protein